MGATLQGGVLKCKVFKIAVVAAVVILVILPVLLADEEYAQVYLQKASEQVKKKDYTSALENFRKAFAEAPEMPEIFYERGLMYWQARELVEALNDFNKVVELFAKKDSLSPAQQEIARKIDSYGTEYDKQRQEFSNINKKYISKFLSLADNSRDSGDNYIRDLLSKLSSLEPKNAEIRKRIKSMEDIEISKQKLEMTPFFNGTDLEGWDPRRRQCRVEDGEIKAEAPEGTLAVSYSCDMENKFSVFANMKIDEIYEKDYMCGIIMAYRGVNDYYVVTFFKGRLVFMKMTEEETAMGKEQKNSFLAEIMLPQNIDVKEWNSLYVQVDGNNVSVYLNSTLQLKVEVPEEWTLKFKGSLGLALQCSKVSFKELLYKKDN